MTRLSTTYSPRQRTIFLDGLSGVAKQSQGVSSAEECDGLYVGGDPINPSECVQLEDNGGGGNSGGGGGGGGTATTRPNYGYYSDTAIPPIPTNANRPKIIGSFFTDPYRNFYNPTQSVERPRIKGTESAAAKEILKKTYLLSRGANAMPDAMAFDPHTGQNVRCNGNGSFSKTVPIHRHSKTSGRVSYREIIANPQKYGWELINIGQLRQRRTLNGKTYTLHLDVAGLDDDGRISFTLTEVWRCETCEKSPSPVPVKRVATLLPIATSIVVALQQQLRVTTIEIPEQPETVVTPPPPPRDWFGGYYPTLYTFGPRKYYVVQNTWIDEPVATAKKSVVRPCLVFAGDKSTWGPYIPKDDGNGNVMPAILNGNFHEDNWLRLSYKQFVELYVNHLNGGGQPYPISSYPSSETDIDFMRKSGTWSRFIFNSDTIVVYINRKNPWGICTAMTGGTPEGPIDIIPPPPDEPKEFDCDYCEKIVEQKTFYLTDKPTANARRINVTVRRLDCNPPPDLLKFDCVPNTNGFN